MKICTISSTTGNNEIVPELIERQTNNIMHPRLSNETNISQHCMQNNNESVENNGGVTNLKAVGNVRVMSINPKGCKPSNQSKMLMLKESIEKYQIDILMMNETNAKHVTS